MRVLVRLIRLDMVEVDGSNPPGPTEFLSLCFYEPLFFQNRAFWRVLARGHYRGKVVVGQMPFKGVQPIKSLAVNTTYSHRSSTAS